MPKYLLNSAGDQFFTPDSSQFYFHDLVGTNYMRYVPNTGHGLNTDAFNGGAAFIQALENGTSLPQFSWTVEGIGENTIRVNTADAPVEVNLWRSTNPNSLDFRQGYVSNGYTSTRLTDQGGGVYVGSVPLPASGGTAFFVELKYNVGGELLTFTTEARIAEPTPPPPPAAPQLVGVNPNGAGDFSNSTLNQIDFSPSELTFVFDVDLDPNTLSGIQIIASGGDNTFDDGNEVRIVPGFLGLHGNSQTVVARFAQTLSDEQYRIVISGQDDLANGVIGLRNVGGLPFVSIDGDATQTIDFDVEVGSQVIAVVPQPVTRDPATGALTQAKNQIDIYFNNDELDATSASNPAYYRLIDTHDHSLLFPQSVAYDAAASKATLTFASDLSTATWQLQIGASEESNDNAIDATDLGNISQQAVEAVYDSPITLDENGIPIPVNIPDGGSVISAISVIDSFFVADLNVQLNIDHQWGPDLRVFLRAAGGATCRTGPRPGIRCARGQIYGAKYDDINGNGVRDENEPGLPGWTIFIDDNLNGGLDPGERSTVTDSEGRYSFLNLELDDVYALVEIPQNFFRSTLPDTIGFELYSTDFSEGANQTLTIVGEATEGTFRLTFDGRVTDPIEFAGPDDGATTAVNIQAALLDLLDPGVALSVVPVNGKEFNFSFTVNGLGTPIDHPALAVFDNSLDVGQIEFSNVGDTSGFTSDGTGNLWHLSSGRANNFGHTPEFSFYFGQNETATGGGAYVNNADATLSSPEIDLTDPTIPARSRRLNHFLSTEEFFDFAEIRVVSGDRPVRGSGRRYPMTPCLQEARRCHRTHPTRGQEIRPLHHGAWGWTTEFRR